MRCLKYYGSLAKKIRSSKNFEKVFARNDVVLTTYDTIRAEYASILKHRQMSLKGKRDDADLTHSPHTADQEYRSEFAGDADQLDAEDKQFLSQGMSMFLRPTMCSDTTILKILMLIRREVLRKLHYLR